MKKLHGVTTAMVTPMDEMGRVNLEGVKQLTNFLIEKGVDCLYPLGTTGEMLKLSIEERKIVAETIIATTKGRATVYIHVGSMSTDTTIELAKHAQAIGADGIGIVTPVFFYTNERELENYFVQVANSVSEDFPVYLYSIPQCAANDISVELLQKMMTRCKNVVGIKYSFGDFVKTQEYSLVNGGDVSVMHGCDRLFAPLLTLGCDGTISGISCVYPEPFVAVYKAFNENNIPEARRLQNIAATFCKVLRGGTNMAYFKSALEHRGIAAGHMRKPSLNLTLDELTAFKKELIKLDELLKEI
ncbi:dihydrodipicolinate synthase family protein [Cellulosilyticum sp. I15G10I2]|uniref:dihydrodipicolinate synthase family protein n=1 Tax=Cellulosilyticum sp. I15G10I2 TaxID=1892843 RepID=UPI00085C5DED|nr:dihydrodipicolinate synthase family protein [Cellulosilyticum sp. I15G10I2]